MTESYADAPRSFAEVRSDKTGKAQDWTPRDSLVATLREIDSGKFSPDALVIVWAETNKETGNVKSGHRTAGKYTTFEVHGLMSYEAKRVME